MEEKIAIQTVKYLYSLDECFKNHAGIERVLRQNILQKAKLIELRKDVNLPKKTTKPRIKCPKCCMPRTQGLAEYRLRKNRISRFHKRIARKIADGDILTKYQEKYLKKRIHKYDQILEINCKICNHKTSEDVKKPEYPKKQNYTEIDNKNEMNTEGRMNKKSKKNKRNKNKGKSTVSLSKGVSNSTSDNQPLPKTKKKKKDLNAKDLPNKTTSFKSRKNKLDKMNALLNSSYKIKNTGLHDFIKSVT